MKVYFLITSLAVISHDNDYYNLAIIELLKWIVLKLRTIITTIL